MKNTSTKCFTVSLIINIDYWNKEWYSHSLIHSGRPSGADDILIGTWLLCLLFITTNAEAGFKKVINSKKVILVSELHFVRFVGLMITFIFDVNVYKDGLLRISVSSK